MVKSKSICKGNSKLRHLQVHNAWYTHRNGVTKRQNRTFIEMIRSILSYNIVSISLWMKSIKAATYMLNRVYNPLVSLLAQNVLLGSVCQTKSGTHFDCKIRQVQREKEREKYFTIKIIYFSNSTIILYLSKTASSTSGSHYWVSPCPHFLLL